MNTNRTFHMGATMNISDYHRIVIVGNNGSGKSYLARKLSQITGIPTIHLDCEFWLPNWEQPTMAEWTEKQIVLTSKEKWIIEGNHTSTMEIRVQESDLIIFIEVNRLTCLLSVLKRHGTKRRDIPEYLEERLNLDYLRFLKGLITFPRDRRDKIIDLASKYPEKKLLIIKGRREMKRLLVLWERYVSIIH